MPSAGITVPVDFGALTGVVPLADLDSNYAAILTQVNALRTYSNYFVDTGTTNSLVITVPGSLTVAYTVGTYVDVKVLNTNSGLSTTLNINSMGSLPIVNSAGVGLLPGEIKAGSVYRFIFDGTSWQLQTTTQQSFSAFKPTGETHASSTALFEDSNLVFNNLPAGTYIVRGFLEPSVAVQSTQGFQWRINVTGTVVLTTYRTYVGVINALPVTEALTNMGSTTSHATIGIGGSDFLNFSGIVQTTTSGKIALQWGPVASSANATTLNALSWMSVQRIG